MQDDDIPTRFLSGRKNFKHSKKGSLLYGRNLGMKSPLISSYSLFPYLIVLRAQILSFNLNVLLLPTIYRHV